MDRKEALFAICLEVALQDYNGSKRGCSVKDILPGLVHVILSEHNFLDLLEELVATDRLEVNTTTFTEETLFKCKGGLRNVKK